MLHLSRLPSLAGLILTTLFAFDASTKCGVTIGPLVVKAFLPNSLLARRPRTFVPLSWSSSYQNSEEESYQTAEDPFLAIPVLGPFPGGLPLMIGAELILDPPTPMQWQTLVKALEINQQHLYNQNMAGIDAAPLVAIMDDYSVDEIPGVKGRYATIAAVVGVSKTQYYDQYGTPQTGFDENDSTSFMDSVMSVGNGLCTPEQCRIRLVGVGRAALRNYYYEARPSTASQQTADTAQVEQQVEQQYYVDEHGRLMDHHGRFVNPQGHLIDEYGRLINEEGQLIDEEGHRIDENGYLIDEHSEDNYVGDINVMVAEFQGLQDGEKRSEEYVEKKERAAFASPVHAINEMHTLANKIHYMHERRRTLVAGLKAATIRLQQAQKQYLNDEYDDHDGIGELFRLKEITYTEEAFQDFRDELEQQTPTYPFAEGGTGYDPSYPVVAQETIELDRRDNYGLGVTATSICSILDLAYFWNENLKPYYSPERRQEEEYYYEVVSYVAILALERVLDPTEIGWALKCTNTVERLQAAYDWMYRHVMQLRDEAEKLSDELTALGAETADLW